MARYNDIIMDHFRNPRNVGFLEDANGIGEIGSDHCGDIVKIYLKIHNDIITDSTFETYGCVNAIASSSIATELIKGKSINYAKSITSKEISDALGGLPEEKLHCSILAEQALQKAIDNYYNKDIKSVN